MDVMMLPPVWYGAMVGPGGQPGTPGLAFELAVLESAVSAGPCLPLAVPRLPESSVDEQIAQESVPMSTPIFQRIKDYLLAEIASGRWKEGELVPSEQA